jgi:glycosyltransferase involved in cell wall biosynthesis
MGRTDTSEATVGRLHHQLRPRVLMVGTHPAPHVGSRSVGEGLAEGLRQRGFDVRVTSRLRFRTLRVADMLVTAWAYRHTYDVAQVDVYSGAAFRWAEWVTRLMRAIGKPYVLTLHGGNLPEFAKKQPLRIGRLLSRAAAVTAPSPYLAQAMYPARRDVQVVPNPFDVTTYMYTERARPIANLVWLRTFHSIYDPVLAVRVLARVAYHADDAHLTMIGPDKDGSLADVRAEAKRLGVLNRILFTGGVAKSDVPGWLSRNDIFLNTSTVDNAPVSVLEAMATGLPIVTTDVGGIPYLVKNGHNAILVPPRDVDAMAEAVMRVLTEPGLAVHLSRNGRAEAEKFGWDLVLRRWEALLADAAGHNEHGNERLTS